LHFGNHPVIALTVRTLPVCVQNGNDGIEDEPKELDDGECDVVGEEVVLVHVSLWILAEHHSSCNAGYSQDKVEKSCQEPLHTLWGLSVYELQHCDRGIEREGM